VLFDGYGPVSGLRGFRDYFRDHSYLRTGFVLCGVAFVVACVGGALVTTGLAWFALPVYVVAAAILIMAVVRLVRDARAGSPTAP
jgi:hypothetical protein